MDSLLYAIEKKLVQVIEFIQNLTFAMILLPSVVYLKDWLNQKEHKDQTIQLQILNNCEFLMWKIPEVFGTKSVLVHKCKNENWSRTDYLLSSLTVTSKST